MIDVLCSTIVFVRLPMREPFSNRSSTTDRLSVDPVTGLLDAMREVGLYPSDPSRITIDGQMHRIHLDGDKPGTRNGWFVLYPDHGAGGSWKLGIQCKWSILSNQGLSAEERRAILQRAEEQRVAAEQLLLQQHREAAERAERLWKLVSPAPGDHPYCLAKQIPPGYAKWDKANNLLVLRLIDVQGKLHGLQYIDPIGIKRFIKNFDKIGHFIGVAGRLPAQRIVIGEGFATCSTVAKAFPGAAVLAALDAGNLKPVALAVRARFPEAEIILASDDDPHTEGNPGLTKARLAAEAASGRVVRPAWPRGIEAQGKNVDFNDAACFLQAADDPEVIARLVLDDDPEWPIDQPMIRDVQELMPEPAPPAETASSGAPPNVAPHYQWDPSCASFRCVRGQGGLAFGDDASKSGNLLGVMVMRKPGEAQEIFRVTFLLDHPEQPFKVHFRVDPSDPESVETGAHLLGTLPAWKIGQSLGFASWADSDLRDPPGPALAVLTQPDGFHVPGALGEPTASAPVVPRRDESSQEAMVRMLRTLSRLGSIQDQRKLDDLNRQFFAPRSAAAAAAPHAAARQSPAVAGLDRPT